jgi:hypothetical protein
MSGALHPRRSAMVNFHVQRRRGRAHVAFLKIDHRRPVSSSLCVTNGRSRPLPAPRWLVASVARTRHTDKRGRRGDKIIESQSWS